MKYGQWHDLGIGVERVKRLVDIRVRCEHPMVFAHWKWLEEIAKEVDTLIDYVHSLPVDEEKE